VTRASLVSILLFCLGAVPVTSWPAETAAVIAKRAQSETMVLRVRVNTEDKGDLFVERTPERDFLVKIQDLKSIGFRDPQGTAVTVDGESYISLASMRGVTFDFQENGLALNITVDPHMLPSRSFAMEGQRSRGSGAVPEGSSGFLNYALNAAGAAGAHGTIGLAGEIGWRFGDFLFLSDGNTTQDASNERKFVRLMSSVTHDDREELQRIVAGDFFTPSRDFSAGVNLGGISLSKLYSLNPYIVQFPTQSVGGTVALPTDLEVYLNGQRIRTQRLQPGEFQLNDILAYGGASNVQLLLRDDFGRVQQLNYSFYFSDQPLRQGLHEYSYNVGALRRNYGTRSNDYGRLAFTMFHRYGLSNSLTLGVRSEATKELFNAGPLATVVLGDAGLLSMALAGSSIAAHQGVAALASYSYQTKRWSMSASVRRDWRDYATLGDPPSVTNRKAEGNLSASYYMADRGAVALSHSVLSIRDQMTASAATPAQPVVFTPLSSRRITALSYSVPLHSGRATLSASLSHIKDQDRPQGRNEAYVGLTIFMENHYSFAGNYRGDKTNNTQSVQLTKSQPIGEGLGFIVSGDRTSDPTGQNLRLVSSVQYNAPAAVLRADLGRNHDQTGQSIDDYRLSVAGGVGFVGGRVAVGRPITDSFGIVRVGQLPGVAVSVNGQPMGKTNAQGEVFVPTLTPYFDNDVLIATEGVPMDYSIPAAVKKVSPSLRSGALIEFAVTKVQAFTGKLKYQDNGVTKPVEFQEFSFNANGKTQNQQTGRGGEFYFENLKPGRYAATVQVDGKPCLFDVVIPKSDETFVELGDLTCRSIP
jgi:outer membrane usher protein